MAHLRLEHVLQVPLPHGRVVWAADLGDAGFARLGWAGVVSDEAKGVLVF